MGTSLITAKKMGILWLLLFALLVGCGGEEPAEPQAEPTEVVVEQPAVAATSTPAVDDTPVPTETAEPLPTITPEPTPITPAITVDDQTLTEEGTIVVESAVSPEAGWLVILADDEDAPGSVLGYTAVAQGASEAIDVTIDPRAATTTLHARLHADRGSSGEFEYPGTDMPLQVASREVVEPFTVEIDLPLPYIEVTDQKVASDGLVQVDEVNALAPGWLVIHTLDEGIVGPAIGQTPVDEGLNKNLAVPIRWRDATAELLAMLHEDKERPGGFSAAGDLPIESMGEPVTAQFAVQLPPDIFIHNQPIVGNKLHLERVVSEKPGWLAIYSIADGQPDRIIGSVKIAQGINYLVDVEVAGTAASTEIALVLHEDTNNPSEFNFPLADPVATYDGEPVPPTIVQINPGNYLITTDQTLGEENEVVIPLAVADLDTWLVIYTQTEDGQPDEIIGQGWLPAGINRDVRIAIPARMEGQTLLAVLHQDAENPREFDYPDGDDVPLQRNRQIILAPFLLEAYSEASSVNP